MKKFEDTFSRFHTNYTKQHNFDDISNLQPKKFSPDLRDVVLNSQLSMSVGNVYLKLCSYFWVFPNSDT